MQSAAVYLLSAIYVTERSKDLRSGWSRIQPTRFNGNIGDLL